ncbi:MAG TPA: hypothetical protein VL357_12320 [Rariglobus sp.]|jgi:hypothetical protein|nr:hypothetical protein [Rariglobus sp.]
MKHRPLTATAALFTLCGALSAQTADWHHTSLHSAQPDGEILHLTVGNGTTPNVIERWWNGKRVRWLDESGLMRPDDVRGNLTGDVLQVDMNGDGVYDGPEDMNVKWCDTDGDGIPDVWSIAVNPKTWGPSKKEQTGHPVWMVFINHDQHGVLGWVDWKKFDFNCWDFTGLCDWLPNYHGNNDFVKTHVPSYALKDARINWENPFSFYDETGNGVSNMAMRWCNPQHEKGVDVDIPSYASEAYLTYDIDGNAGKDNETSYDMTLRAAGGHVDTSAMVHPLPHFAGDPKFDPCFYHNEWRRVKELVYMDRDKGYQTFFASKWKSFYFTFDEDGDNHRWEREELMYPTTNLQPNGPAIDLYSTAHSTPKDGRTPGLGANFQADTLGDRGEFDLTGAGGGKLYVGPFDRKLHLYGAKWGAWTVDKNAEFNGGAGEPTRHPPAPKVEEVVKYTDTDGDGFIDTIEYDYAGARHIDLKVCLLDYKDKDGKAPQTASLIDPAQLGWKGLHELFNQTAQQSWTEALSVYRAAWQRDLTSSELDTLAAASSYMQRYQNAYWIKEKVFRALRARLLARIETHPEETPRLQQLLADYIRAYYTGHFDEVVRLIGQAPISS